MSKEYIEFGDRKSTDFGLTIQKDGVDISQPEENRIEATLPFMNGFYDFSKMAGERTYKQRDITIKFSLSAKDENELYRRKCDVVRWLSGAKGELRISFLTDYHFVGATAVFDTSAFEFTSRRTADLTVNFKTYPFLRSDDYSDIGFDNFNFETDCLNLTDISLTAVEQTQYAPPATLKVYSYDDRPIRPRLSYKRSEDDTRGVGFTYFALNDKEISASVYRNTEKEFDLDELTLQPGVNTLAAYGFGTLTLNLYEEVL